jgi:hypothetical protein
MENPWRDTRKCKAWVTAWVIHVFLGTTFQALSYR